MTMLSTSMRLKTNAKIKTDMKITRSILLIAFLMLFYRAFGQPAERLIRIQITPNHTDWLYKPGEKIEFSITVLKNNVPIRHRNSVPDFRRYDEASQRRHIAS